MSVRLAALVIRPARTIEQRQSDDAFWWKFSQQAATDNDTHLDPDCASDKHRACRGEAWCTVVDAITACVCDCHEPTAAVG